MAATKLSDDAICGKQRQRRRSILPLIQNFDRPGPGQFLRLGNLAQMKNMLLNDAPTRDALALDDAPATMPLAAHVANLVVLWRKNMVARHCSQIARRENTRGEQKQMLAQSKCAKTAIGSIESA